MFTSDNNYIYIIGKTTLGYQVQLLLWSIMLSLFFTNLKNILEKKIGKYIIAIHPSNFPDDLMYVGNNRFRNYVMRKKFISLFKE